LKDVHVEVSKSVIGDAVVYSDSLRTHMPTALASALQGVTYDRAGIENAIHRCALLIDAAEQAAARGELTAPLDDVAVDMLSSSVDRTAALNALHIDDRNALHDVQKWLIASL
jgi:hypothetical protein